MGKHNSMRSVGEYEANYVNAAGYSMNFHHVAFALRQEALAEKRDDGAVKFDDWEKMLVRYGLKVVSLRAEFCNLAAEDPTYKKLVVAKLEKKDSLVTAYNKVDEM